MNIRHTLAAALAAATMLTAASAALADPGVTTGTVNFREEPEVDEDNVIGVLSKGTILEILECGDGWCLVEVDGEEGYVSAKYLALLSDDDDDEDDEDDDYDDDHHDDGPDIQVCLGGGGLGGGGFGYGQLCIED
jgi:hypothetical protein